MNNSLNKKIVKFQGGLGNQMFQYAFAFALAKETGAEILFDFDWFKAVYTDKNVTTRTFELGAFNAECKPACEEDLKLVIYKDKRNLLEKLLWALFKIKDFKPQKNIIRQKNAYVFEKKFLTKPNVYYYEGYFQNEKYFKHCRKELLGHFSLRSTETLDAKNSQILEQIKGTNSVSIHIRRGDYVTLESASKFHGTCSLEYYEKAIEYIAKRVKNPHFYLFSDDIDWVQANLKINHLYTVVDFNQEKSHFDLELMKNCKHNIVANSSFSWWGAWLNENPDKIVITPKNWIAANQKCDIVPNGWVKL